MIGKISGSFSILLFVFSAAVGHPPKEVPSAMTLQQMEAYLAGNPVDETLPAETFGYPRPDRALELEKQLELNLQQKKDLENIINGRHRDAILMGRKIVAEELLLDDLFRKGDNDLPSFYADLSNRLESIQGWRWRLRLAHLGALVKTKMTLTSEQLKKYHALRLASPGGGLSK